MYTAHHVAKQLLMQDVALDWLLCWSLLGAELWMWGQYAAAQVALP